MLSYGCSQDVTQEPAWATQPADGARQIGAAAKPLGIAWRERRESVANKKFHLANPVDWVGEAHNMAMDAFRKELRKPSRVNNACALIREVAFAEMKNAVESRHQNAPDKIAMETILRPLLPQIGCDTVPINRRRVSISPAANARSIGTTVDSLELTAAGEALMDSVQIAVANTSSSSGLASALSPILASATALGEGDQLAVSTIAAIAVSSAEYWESEVGGFVDDVASEFGPCVSAVMGNVPDPVEYCMNGGIWGYTKHSIPRRMFDEVPIRNVAFYPTSVPLTHVGNFALISKMECPSLGDLAWHAVPADVGAGVWAAKQFFKASFWGAAAVGGAAIAGSAGSMALEALAYRVLDGCWAT